MQGINQKNQKKSTQKHEINQVSNNKFEPASETAARNLTPPPPPSLSTKNSEGQKLSFS